MFWNRFFRPNKPNKDSIKEGAGEREDLLKVTMSDEDLVQKIDLDVQKALPLYQRMKSIQDENEDYYLGDQLDKTRFDWELPTAENLLYMATETIVSIISANRKEPIVLPAQSLDESRELADKTQQFLSWKWSDQDMIIKFEDWVRQSMISRIGVLKLRFDSDKDDFEIENIRPQKIMVDPEATDEYNARYIIEFRKDTLDELISLFPEAADKLKSKFGKGMGTEISYLEYWTNEFVVWKVGELILSKKKNPNWNWEENDRNGSLEKLKERWKGKTKEKKLKNLLLNYFNEPRKPYVVLSLKNLGKDIYGDTGDFDQGRVIQDIINRRKRQIDKAAVKALGREVYSGSFISKDEAKKSVANPNAPVWLRSGKANEAVSYIAPTPVSPVLLDDFRESKEALDNVMGTHGTTRGERGSTETATGRTILREGDYGRIDLSVRRIDKKLELLYSWMLQMAKVYYNEQHYVKMLGQEGATSYLRYSGDDVEDGQEVIVKSELTVDRSTKRENAVRRLQAGLSDPLSYFEDLDVTNAKERARRLVYYNLDPKLYIQNFCFDENAEGAENTSEGKAKQEQKKIIAGEKVPPTKDVDEAHLKEHIRFAETGEFKNNEDVEMKQEFSNHLRAEADSLKALRESV